MCTSGPTSDSHFGRELVNGKEPGDTEWTINIKEQFHHPMDCLRSLSDVSIFRVPNVLMKESKNGEAYIPQRVSLGPYHHRNAKLRPMDSHKGRALNRMTTRFNKNRNFADDSTNMEFFVRSKQKILQLENEIKKRYEEEISCDGEALALMLSLDGCFILEILRTICGEFDEPSKASKCYEPIFKQIKIEYCGGDIVDDILKLENQIPLIVLQKLLELELELKLNCTDVNCTDVKRNIFKLMYKLGENIYPFNDEYKCVDMDKFLEEDGAQEVDHLLGFWHRLIVSPPSHNAGERVGGDTRLAHQDDDTSFPHEDQDSASLPQHAGYTELPHQDQDSASLSQHGGYTELPHEDQDSASLPQHAGYTELPHQEQDGEQNGEGRDRNHEITVNGVNQESAVNGVEEQDENGEIYRQMNLRSRAQWSDADRVHSLTTGRGAAGEGAAWWICDENSAGKNPESTNIHRAVELGNAGIKFKGGSGGIKDITFDPKSSTISLPAITITDLTEVLLRNLIALEMCKPSQTNYVACYVCLMDQLIDSEADVAFLRKNGIVKNCLGSDEEVAKLFNGLCKGVTVSLEGVFNNLTEKVNEHYRNKFNVQCAEFAKEYFSSVWKALAWAGAIFVVLLTVVQTIFAIVAVYK